MKKKPEEADVREEVVEKVVVKKKIEKIDFNFGRGDLNMLRDKLNEVIENQ